MIARQHLVTDTTSAATRSYRLRQTQMSQRLIAIVATLAVLVSLVIAMPAPHAQAAGNRDWLRPGCSWAPQGHWIQRCFVPSPANGRDMEVFIQPGRGAGNGGLYLLDGLQAKAGDNYWLRTSAMTEFINDNVTLVMPAGGTAQFYQDWQTDGHPVTNGYLPLQLFPVNPRVQWETFLTAELPVWLQQHFGVSPQRNSIAGISMGTLSAAALAGRHPDQFKQLLALSGFLDPAMLGRPGMVMGVHVGASLFGGGQIWEMFGGDPVSFARGLDRLDPITNVGGLRNTDVVVYTGNGRPAPGDFVASPLEAPFAGIGEVLIERSSMSFVDKARRAGVAVDYHHGTGEHMWQCWERELHADHDRVLRVVG